MEFNKKSDYHIFDSLISDNIHFALYRLPGESNLNFILQHSDVTIRFDLLSQLNTQHGFVLAPYCISERHPVIVINEDVHLHTDTEIFSYLRDNRFTSRKGANHSARFSKKYTFELYKQIFASFMDELNSGNVQKLVLSRAFDIDKKSGFSEGQSFHKACIAYPDNFIYLCHTPVSGTWLGCSPEKLISGQSETWTTDALAGTQSVDKNKVPVWDKKNRDEQQIVVDYMQRQLIEAGIKSKHGEAENFYSGNLIHLRSKFEFSLPNSSKIGVVLEKLHPSPAVNGFPKKEALEFITANEGYDREYYSGFIGYLNKDSNTDLFVNLRCMKIDSELLRLYAGGGILPSSDVRSEWEETENKLQTVLSII